MKWVTRERPKTDRIACPWLIRKLHRPRRRVPLRPRRRRARGRRARRRALLRRARRALHPPRRPLHFEVLVEEYEIERPGGAPARADRPRRRRRRDRDATPSRAACSPSPKASSTRCSTTIASSSSALPVYDALYAWCRHAGSRPADLPRAARTRRRIIAVQALRAFAYGARQRPDRRQRSHDADLSGFAGRRSSCASLLVGSAIASLAPRAATATASAGAAATRLLLVVMALAGTVFALTDLAAGC